jgi:hypothetical protein
VGGPVMHCIDSPFQIAHSVVAVPVAATGFEQVSDRGTQALQFGGKL